ncbi:MAG: DUF4037 domain-containing protein, partial [Firmicutes bacterium]|nr:DUF4037 domain-containing protein [Candidatus Caballimonas caccae]
MKGLELSKKYYEEFGKAMLEKDFPQLLKYIAVGFVGSGSERYGFDDEISIDHDFEPGFSIFLPSEDVVSRRDEFLLERAYSKLPKEFMGYKRQQILPVGGNRNGVIRTFDFYKNYLGNNFQNLSLKDWLFLPDSTLFEATDGEVFYDGYGEFTFIRKSLNDMPKGALYKRLAGNILIMAQSGQYNYSRCYKRGEIEASILAKNEFINSLLKVLFLLKGKYMPYYKWSFKALRAIYEDKMVSKISKLLLDGENNKSKLIEEISLYVINELKKQNLSDID